MILGNYENYSIYPNFANKGGAQDIALCLAKKMNKDQLPIILTETPFQEIEKEYRIGDVIFEKFSIKNILRYADNERSLFLIIGKIHHY